MFVIKNEPIEVTRTREKILTEFSDLEFYEEGHKYLLHGKTLRSASGIGELFCSRPFDAEAASKSYAKKNGMTPEHWRCEWELNGFRAACLGSKTHAFGESMGYLLGGHPEMIADSILPQYHKEHRRLVPIHPKEEAIVSFFNDLPACYHLVLNEAKAYSGKNPDPAKNLKEQICGTFDMLYYYDGCGNPEKSGYIIMDYKTNEKLTDDFSRSFGTTLQAPFNDLYQEAKSFYTIQLSLYALMLEDIGIKIIDRKIIWLKNNGSYQRISLPDVSDRLRALERFPEK